MPELSRRLSTSDAIFPAVFRHIIIIPPPVRHCKICAAAIFRHAAVYDALPDNVAGVARRRAPAAIAARRLLFAQHRRLLRDAGGRSATLLRALLRAPRRCHIPRPFAAIASLPPTAGMTGSGAALF